MKRVLIAVAAVAMTTVAHASDEGILAAVKATGYFDSVISECGEYLKYRPGPQNISDAVIVRIARGDSGDIGAAYVSGVEFFDTVWSTVDGDNPAMRRAYCLTTLKASPEALMPR